MGNLTEKIKKQLNKKGIKVEPRLTRSWFLTKVKELRITRASLFEDKEKLRGRTILGRFYFFYYDPKTKDSLPYYDRFPLTIPIHMYDDGFLGLNFHYVSPQVRIQLLSKLMNYASDRKLTETTRLQLSYPILKSASSLYQATPCIKRYLWNHVRSRFMELDATDWNSAMQLPFQMFVKETDKQIWNNSAQQAQNGN